MVAVCETSSADADVQDACICRTGTTSSGVGIAPGVTAAECAEHLVAHAERADVDAASRDESGWLDGAHAAARAIMLAELVASGEVTRG